MYKKAKLPFQGPNMLKTKTKVAFILETQKVVDESALIFVLWAFLSPKILIKATKAAFKGHSLSGIFSNVDFREVPI